MEGLHSNSLKYDLTFQLLVTHNDKTETPISDSAFISEKQNTTSTKVNIMVFSQKTHEDLLCQQHPENMLS